MAAVETPYWRRWSSLFWAAVRTCSVSGHCRAEQITDCSTLGRCNAKLLAEWPTDICTLLSASLSGSFRVLEYEVNLPSQLCSARETVLDRHSVAAYIYCTKTLHDFGCVRWWRRLEEEIWTRADQHTRRGDGDCSAAVFAAIWTSSTTGLSVTVRHSGSQYLLMSPL